MLVLSRKKGESLQFAGMDIEIRVVSCTKSKVQLGIDAPREVVIKRSELVQKDALCEKPRQRPVDFSAQILEELSRIEAELAALAELADPKDRPVARSVASDAIARLVGVERAIRMTAKTRPMGESPISDYVQQKPAPWPTDSETVGVREQAVAYGVGQASLSVA